MARKKKAPAIKSNLRDVPADKFRAVNRMNGIVTMVEYSSEDDIKAYELEPTFRELGGGGGVEINNPTLTINYHNPAGTSDLPFETVFQKMQSFGYVSIVENTLTPTPVLNGTSGTLTCYITGQPCIISFASPITNIRIENNTNCILASEEGFNFLNVVDITQNASLDLYYEIGGIS